MELKDEIISSVLLSDSECVLVTEWCHLHYWDSKLLSGWWLCSECCAVCGPCSTTEHHRAPHSLRPPLSRKDWTAALSLSICSQHKHFRSCSAPSHHYFTKPHHVTTLGTMMSYLIPTVVLSACLSRFYSKHEKFAAAAAVMANISAVARQGVLKSEGNIEPSWLRANNQASVSQRELSVGNN